ncbi:MAG: hypothetical protein AMXMBFR33_43450 [Candidatus Xenobia bacterium]
MIARVLRRPLALLALLLLYACSGETTFTEGAVPAMPVEESRTRLLLDAQGAENATSNRLSGQVVIRSRTVRLNPDLIAQGDLWVDELQDVRIELFEDAVFDLNRVLVQKSASGNLSWSGASGDGAVQATFTARGDLFVGLLTAPGATYRLRSAGEGLVVVQQLGPGGSCCGDAPLAVLPEPLEQARLAENVQAEDIQALTNEGYIIDVLQLYTDDLAEYYFPGQSNANQLTQMTALIDNDVAWANAAYKNSQVNIALRTVHIAEVTYTESGNAQADLYRLCSSGEATGNSGSPGTLPTTTGGLDWRTGGPYLDNVHTLRTTYGADLVMMRCKAFQVGVGGVGFLTPEPNTAYNIYGFAVMANPDDVTEITMTHEIGHNQGLAHDFATNGGYPAAPTPRYARGYRVTNQFATIMAYPDPNDWDLVLQYFSNPALQVNVPGVGLVTLTDTSLTGDDRPDEHRRLNEMVDTISNYRTHVSAYSPLAPTGLNATVPDTTSIRVYWTDPMDGEDGFRVERRLQTPSNSPWSTFNVAANVTEYNDTGLTEGVGYVYRVRTKVGSEYSPYSSQIVRNPRPEAPTNLIGTALDQSRIRIDWTDNSTHETNYFAERRIGTTGSWTAVQLASNATTHTFTGLPASSSIYLRVRARAGGTYSTYCQWIAVKTGPAAPSGLTGAATGPTSVQLNWVDNSSDESAFYLEYRLASVGTWSGHNASASGPYLKTGLASGQTYVFRMKARRGPVFSTPSNEVQVTTP